MFTCFNIISGLIEEANKRFEPFWTVNKEKFAELENYCDAIDRMAKEYDAVSYNVAVDEVSMVIKIEMECPELTVTDKDCDYCQLLPHTLSFGFSVSEDGNLWAKFTFPGIWKRA